MSIFRPLGRVAGASMRWIVGAITTGLDALTRLVARINAFVEADLDRRTRLLQARYARDTHTAGAPLPVIDAPIDLALRADRRNAARG